VDDDRERAAVPPVGHELVPQHQIGRDGPEQLLIDAEGLHVHELDAVALSEPPRVIQLGDPIVLAGLRPLGVKLRLNVDVCHAHLYRTELNWKRGM
jgi:hypothetical protein